MGEEGGCSSPPVPSPPPPPPQPPTYFLFTQAALDKEDTPWAAKLPAAVWRGAATGVITDQAQGARYHLLTRWGTSPDPRVDVGMTAMQGALGNASRVAALLATAKPAMTMAEMLRYRYLISVEGNDVATNLKWAMWSASAVIMPRPTVCSWFMEDRLVPWKHFIPVTADFGNLTAAVDWCEAPANAGACQAVAAAGRAYVEAHGFMDADADRALARVVAATAVRRRGDMA